MRIFSLVCVLFQCIVLHGQTDSSFLDLVNRTNLLYDLYEPMHPGWGDYYVSLNNYNLTEQEIAEIKKYYDIDSELSENKDSITPYSLIMIFQDMIFENIDSIFKYDVIEKYEISELLKVPLSVSSDNKLYICTLDEKTGGSWRSRIGKIYFIMPTGAVRAEDIQTYDDHSGAAYGEIYTLKKHERYLILGGGVGCNTCGYSVALSIVVDNENIDSDFLINIGYRFDNILEFDYDTTSQILSFQYLIDDVSVYNFEKDANKTMGDTVSGSYVYNGETIEEVSNYCSGSYIRGRKNGKWVCGKDELNYIHGRLNGKQLAFYSDGKMKKESYYINDTLNGVFKKWYMDGLPSRLCFYDKGEAVKYNKKWHDNGKIKYQFQYNNDNSITVYREWHSNGKKKFILNFKKKKFKEWYENGQLVKEFYSNKKEFIFHTPHGRIKTKGCFYDDSSCNKYKEELYSNLYFPTLRIINGEKRGYSFDGATNRQVSMIYYKNSTIIPPSRSWTSNGHLSGQYIREGRLIKNLVWDVGQLYSESYTDNNGKQDSVYYRWNSKGQKIYERHYSNNLRNGYWKEWYKNGQLKEICQYKDGHKVGENNLWYNDGRLSKSSFFNNKGHIDGKVLFYDYYTGNLKSESLYENGKQIEYKEWNEYDFLIKHSKYVNGKQIEYKEWNESGFLIIHSKYVNGKRINLLK